MAMDWQSIETAPKDGTSILGGKPGMAAPWVVRWRNGKRIQDWETSYSFIGFKPTLWMPLPKPPSE
ncbi:MAG: hypothetical protein K0S94_2900 [Nitrospira sp.]|nr:hypothetical protein [Nitrospira sp.]